MHLFCLYHKKIKNKEVIVFHWLRWTAGNKVHVFQFSGAEGASVLTTVLPAIQNLSYHRWTKSVFGFSTNITKCNEWNVEINMGANHSPLLAAVSKRFKYFVCLMDNSCYFPPCSSHLHIRLNSSHWQWSIITQNKTRAGHKNKHNISSVCEDCMALCKNCAIISLAFFKNKRINMSIFPTFVPFHAVLLLFISRSASDYL